MAFKTMKMTTIEDPPVSQWQPPNLAGGVVYTDLPMNLQDNQSHDMLNMWYKEKVLTKRYGQEYYALSGTSLPILTFYDKKFNGYTVFTSGTGMYKIDSLGVVSLIYNSLTASKGSFFTLKNKTTGLSILYYINAYQFIQWDGSIVNLLGTDGDCEDVSKWSLDSMTTSLDSSNKVFGSNSIKMILTSATGYLVKIASSFNLNPLKYYMFSAYVKNGNATSGVSLYKDSGGGGITKNSAVQSIDTTKFVRISLPLAPGDLNIGNAFAIRVNGTVGQYGYVDGVMINEITQVEYNNASYVPPPFTTSNIPVSTVQSSAYIPTVLMGRAPVGGGTVLEQYNAIGAGFTTSFSPTGTATVFTLPQTNLDATLLTCTSLGVTKVETTDFTVNRTTGLVTFTTAPVLGTDTLKIIAYKTDLVQLGYILGCKYSITFGGNNDTRVFLAGDSTTYYYSGLQDPSYWPENQYNNAGADNTYITGFGKMYDTLVVFKEKSLGVITYLVNADGSNPSFPYGQMNSVIGCDMPYTIQLVNNNLVWCTTYGGVYSLISDTQIKDEKNVRPLSHNINGTIQRPALLQELKTNLQNASSINFYGMYWLCVGSKVYIWDYSISPFANSGDLDQDQVALSWFPQTNINANCFFGVDQDLYYGDLLGNIIHFKNNYTDFGLAINGYWQCKILNFGLFNWFKYILDLRYSTKTDTLTQIMVTYYNDTVSRIDNKTDKVGSGSWVINWSSYIWSVINYAKTFYKIVKIPQTEFFSVKFSNNNIGENLSILDLTITYIKTRLIR